MAMCLRELIEFHESFIKMVMKRSGELKPQMIYELDGKANAVVFMGDFRAGILQVLDALRGKPISWLIMMNEGYQEELDFRKMTPNEINNRTLHHVTGSLQKRFEHGDKSVKEVIVMTVYTKRLKLSLTYDKDMNKIKQTEEFDGLLTVNDMDRISWASSGLDGQSD